MRRTVLLFAMAFLVAACGPPPPAPVKPETQTFIQPFTIRVLDAKDRPVELAKVVLTAQKGSPQGSAHYETDKLGEVNLAWRPQVVNYTAGSHSRDEVFDLLSRFQYVIAKKGYFPARGMAEAAARGRRLYDPNLKTLSREPVLAPKSETVILRRLGEVFGGQLTGKPLSDPLIARLMAFHKDMVLVASHLGVAFAWPAFVLDRQCLTLQFAWRGGSWADLGHAPLLAQVTTGAILPFARAVGEELSGLPGVIEAALVVVSETTPPNDPHALPEKATIKLRAPLEAYRLLAANGISPDGFLTKYPPRLKVEKPPRSAETAPSQATRQPQAPQHPQASQPPQPPQPPPGGGPR
jgi:hypothetical protein